MLNDDNVILIDTATAKRSIIATAYFQFDKGLKIRLLNVPDNRDYQIKIEMCNAGATEITHTILYSGADVEIPRELLMDGRDVKIFLFVYGDNWGRTSLDVLLRIVRRPSR